MRSLLFIPTYNEKDNVARLCQELLDLNLPVDLLFIDDGSPDGTGEILDRLALGNKSLNVIHRSGKQGIGSAHQFGIRYAYENGYQVVMSMDADFTHRPQDLLSLWMLKDEVDVVVGSRYMSEKSLPGWNFFRRFLTKTGHFLTVSLLGMPYDATGALRLYRIDRIPQSAFQLVESKGYSFFFESLFVLFKNHYRIAEIPITLPARTYGSSKMSLREVGKSVSLLVKTFFQNTVSPSKFRISKPLNDDEIDAQHHDPQGWDQYWEVKKSGWSFIYDLVADVYRKVLIRPSLNRFIKANFSEGSKLLHAGCGGGQVDSQLRSYADILPLDISVNALNWYRRVNGDCRVVHGSVFDIPLPNESVDGVYNLGVMEHFTEEEISRILAEFSRIIKPQGKIVLFWPPEFGVSVMFFKCLGSVLRIFGRKDAKFHPAEITRVRSREHVKRLLESNGFVMSDYYFGIRDMYTQAMIVGKRAEPVQTVLQAA
jgi:dolichol-phosphate mannosyltransferase